MMEKKVVKNRVQRVCSANLKAVYYAITRITGRYRKFEGDLYNYEACYERNFTTRELAKEIEKETAGLSYYQIRTCIKQLRLQEYIKFPEKGVCRILKSIEEKEDESVKESFYLPDYFLQAVKQKCIDWKPCDTLLLHYVLKRTDFYNHCKEKAFDSIKKWNDFEDREYEITQGISADFERLLVDKINSIFETLFPFLLIFLLVLSTSFFTLTVEIFARGFFSHILFLVLIKWVTVRGFEPLVSVKRRQSIYNL